MPKVRQTCGNHAGDLSHVHVRSSSTKKRRLSIEASARAELDQRMCAAQRGRPSANLPPSHVCVCVARARPPVSLQQIALHIHAHYKNKLLLNATCVRRASVRACRRSRANAENVYNYYYITQTHAPAHSYAHARSHARTQARAHAHIHALSDARMWWLSRPPYISTSITRAIYLQAGDARLRRAAMLPWCRENHCSSNNRAVAVLLSVLLSATS